jgi:hypothetical protein
MGNQHTSKTKDLEEQLKYYQGLASALERENKAEVANRISREEQEAAKVEEQKKAEDLEKKTRTLVRLSIHRLDGSVDEVVQSFARVKPGESISVSTTPALV